MCKCWQHVGPSLTIFLRFLQNANRKCLVAGRIHRMQTLTSCSPHAERRWNKAKSSHQLQCAAGYLHKRCNKMQNLSNPNKDNKRSCLIYRLVRTCSGHDSHQCLIYNIWWLMAEYMNWLFWNTFCFRIVSELLEMIKGDMKVLSLVFDPWCLIQRGKLSLDTAVINNEMHLKM